jgi:hypothetical protein
MSQLAIQYPFQYSSIFEPLTDFHVIDDSKYEEYVGGKQDKMFQCCPKPIWWDISSGLPDTQPAIGFQAFILPTHDDPDRNMLEILKWHSSELLRVGIWRGERRHLKLIDKDCDIVALPWYEHRSIYVLPEDSHKYHFYEFSSLDELRRFPCRSLQTSVPITAAMAGIDLRHRERRPKKLPTFSYDMKMNEAQLELAVENVKAIREALDSHGT